ncbi:hypothetical protein GGR57DRAFT_519764 [Xylariaceae sp. FL1272]|nr:hypothetical protein GGR57DRAFT_519764 [Xylariaceae sp. FL1272]
MALLADDEVFIQIDPDGDLELVVGHEAGYPKHHFTVCSKTMSRSSPVFKAMLYGSFAESKDNQIPGEAWVVELPEDDPYSMEMLLTTMHGIFEVEHVLTAIGKNGDIDNLYELAVLVDKYDLVKQLRPWVREFIEPHLNAYVTTKQQFKACDENLKWLWVAFVIGDRDLFHAMSGAFIETCDEHFGDAGEERTGPIVITPPEFTETIKQIRAKIVAKYLEALRTLVSKTKARNPEEPCEWPHKSDRRMLDILKDALESQSVWPLPSADKVTGSAWELRLKVYEVFEHLHMFSGFPQMAAAQGKLMDIQEEIDYALDAFMDRYLENQNQQALKSGFKGSNAVISWRNLFNLDY